MKLQEAASLNCGLIVKQTNRNDLEDKYYGALDQSLEAEAVSIRDIQTQPGDPVPDKGWEICHR